MPKPCSDDRAFLFARARRNPGEFVLLLFSSVKDYDLAMSFVDEAVIEVHAGKGGDGVASFRREKFVPRGGPDGGDGGRGGSIHAVADRNINTLIDYRYARIHRAKNGDKGQGADCYGRAAQDIELRFPVGTVITDFDTGDLIADLACHEARALLAKGGKGGLGNLHFKSSVNR